MGLEVRMQSQAMGTTSTGSSGWVCPLAVQSLEHAVQNAVLGTMAKPFRLEE